MRDKNDLIYHVVDWTLAIIQIICSVMIGKMINIIWILCIALSISLIIFLIKKLKKYEKYKKQNSMYSFLLNSPYPLYGIVNYLSKDINKEYCNNNIELKKLYLEVSLTNDIIQQKHNDLFVFWKFEGVNIKKDTLGYLYQRIGGDSSSDLRDLNYNAVDCHQDVEICKTDCGYYISDQCPNNYKMSVEDINEFSSKTFHLLKLGFSKPIGSYGNFLVKSQYVWPQCFNPYYDFLLIDPNNFASKIKELEIKVWVDDIIITSDTEVFLSCFCTKTEEYNDNLGRFEYFENDKCFKYVCDKIDNEKMYYVNIKNCTIR